MDFVDTRPLVHKHVQNIGGPVTFGNRSSTQTRKNLGLHFTHFFKPSESDLKVKNLASLKKYHTLNSHLRLKII